MPVRAVGESLEGEQHLAAEGEDPLAEIVADQRGAARPFGDGCDVGSVEAGAAAPAEAVGPRSIPAEIVERRYT